MADSPMLALLAEGNWDEYQPQFDALAVWEHYPLLLRALAELNHSALFVSKIHGLGHIERTLLQGGFCAMAEGLSRADTALLLDACSYHDVGRLNDWADDQHGHRAAQRMAELTGRTGEELKLIQGAVDAHSRRDVALVASVRGYRPADLSRAVNLAQLLKDADGLDRVRLGDLNPAFLRRESSRQRADLARAVFLRYQEKIGAAPKPFFSEEEIAAFRAKADQKDDSPKA